MTGKDIIKITLNLVVIYVIGGLILAVVHATTSPIRYRNNIIAEQKALKGLMPDADKIDKLGDWVIHEKDAKYWVAKKGDDIIGYVVQSYGKGYSSYIKTLIAVDKDFRVKKIEILDEKETPGLGDEIETPWFKKQFGGKDLDHLKVLKTETTEYIQALTGATISSRAVTEDAVASGVKFIKEKIQGGGGAEHVSHK
jgi:electron transport complex protein RnfG